MADFRLVVYDSAIAAMSLPGGQTWRWARQRRNRIERLAKAQVGVRTAELKHSIYGTYEPGRPNQIVMEVWAGTNYALYHHEGFGPKVMPRGSYMYLPAYPAGGYFHTTKTSYRSGFRGNAFLRDPLLLVMGDL